MNAVPSPKRILIVDDEPDVTDLLRYQLVREGFNVAALNNPLQVMGLARDFQPDLIVLDVMMPELDGCKVSRMIRSDRQLSDVPIIFLTAKSDVIDRIAGLESGGDDYMSKPYDIKELILRLNAMLKRKTRSVLSDTIISAGPIVLDMEKHEVTVSGSELILTATEFKLLRLLMERVGRVQTRDNLLVNVWNYDTDTETRTIDTHVRRLREKLGSAANMIETVRGVGYRMNKV
jgi:two-component system phosphate regulon response regulator PhoB